MGGRSSDLNEPDNILFVILVSDEDHTVVSGLIPDIRNEPFVPRAINKKGGIRIENKGFNQETPLLSWAIIFMQTDFPDGRMGEEKQLEEKTVY